MIKTEDTRLRILMTAMAMFSEDGIDAVTLRSINTSAGCSNTGAVHYHFCNKDGLIQAIIDFLQKKIWPMLRNMVQISFASRANRLDSVFGIEALMDIAASTPV